MASGFVSGGTTENPIEHDDDWIKAQKELEETRRQKAEASQQQESGKSLYEVLQANKDAKQQAFEESIRLKNQFRSLDDDEVDFLDAVLESTRAQEDALKKETSEQLSLFRQEQEKAERAYAAQAGVDVEEPAAEDEAQWQRAARKRKRQKSEIVPGLKMRRTSSVTEVSSSSLPAPKVTAAAETTVDQPAKAATKSGIQDSGEAVVVEKGVTKDKESESKPPSAGLGLGDYDSDDD